MKPIANLETARWLDAEQTALLLTGWVYSSGGTPAYSTVRVRAGDHCEPAYYGMPRPDVRSAHGGIEAAEFSGFSALVATADLSWPLELEVARPDGHGEVFLVVARSDVQVANDPLSPATALAARTGATGLSTGAEKPVLLISHDFAYAGAQLILLRFARWLKENRALPFEILVNVPRSATRHASSEERHILDGFHALGVVHFLSDLTGAPENLSRLRGGDYRLVYANTSTLGVLLAAMQPVTTPVVSHVYELGFWIERRTGRHVFARQAAHTTRFIACARAVRDVLVDRLGVPTSRIEIIHACASTERARKALIDHDRAAVRESIGVPPDAFVIQACGTFDWRKGADLFVPICVALRRLLPNLEFQALWIGDAGSALVRDQFEHEVELAGLQGRVRLIVPQHDLPRWMRAADAFALPSREDPFPMVMLEAGALGIPVIGFDRSGGVTEYVEGGGGLAVPYLDIDRFAAALAALAADPGSAATMGENGRRSVEGNYDHELSYRKALELIRVVAPS